MITITFFYIFNITISFFYETIYMEAIESCETKTIIDDKLNTNNTTNNINIKETTSIIINEITFQEIIDRIHN
jgi:hypothetical protein